MEETMSSYSFSHQFYQHWTQAPEPIRAAIVQELTDIATLLQPDTSLENFVFSQPDLDAYLDKLDNTYKTQQAAAKKTADKKAAEQQRLEKAESNKVNAEKGINNQQNIAQQQAKVATENSITEQTSNNKTPDNQASSNNQHSNDDRNKAASAENDDAIDDSSNTLDSNNALNINDTLDDKSKDLSAGQVDTDSNVPKQGAAIERLPKTPKLSKDNEDLIHELGMHIDDYLSEQMAQLSEDLKSWLRNEISRQLGDQEQTVDSGDKEKQ
ncbi:hypothetical protein [Psychrobacter urativorans]|uniref:hypothetical protein n=1 Tax=Psychrobacter urativorans TaxID=45610 RepID=UPI00191A66EA|nr:hypothetical protein [Psychrobacter urativorans]